jgi:hypothetical protein
MDHSSQAPRTTTTWSILWACRESANGRNMSPPWNEHPKLRGRFHPEFPDDLQVIVHDGGPHTSDRRPELVWVRVTECQDEVFSAVVLNQPAQLRCVAQGSHIQFIVPEGGQYPLQVTRKYLQERSAWRLLMPCEKCGLTELFDPPSQLLAASFPSVMPDQLSRGFTFTTRCGWCGNGIVVRLKRTNWPWSQGTLQ